MDYETPYRPASTDTLELRILHGPQAGSTLPLEDGQAYTLGTSENCAVLLAGTQLEAEHASITADGEGIHVTALQGKVMAMDRTEVLPGKTVALGTVLRLGRVKLTVDRLEAPWPQDDALEEPDTAAPLQDGGAEPGTPAPQSAPAVRARALPARKAAARSIVAPLLLTTAATMLVGAAIAAWVTQADAQSAQTSAQGLRTSSTASNHAAAPASALHAAQQREQDFAALSRAFPDATLRAVLGEGDAWALGGRIATEEGRRRLRDAAAALRPPPEFRVMLDAQRLAAVMDFVQKRRAAGELELTVQPAGNGAIRIGGAAASQAGLTAFMDSARKELADAQPLEFAVLLRPELAAKFDERLRAAGLAPKFKVIRREPQLELQAVLTGAEVRTWENLFRDFTTEWGSVLPISAQVQHERDTMEALIETVVAGPFPYVVTTSGRRVSPGGGLDGRTLVAIRDGELFFSDGLRVRYAQ